MNENLILISNTRNWVEQAAKDQLEGVSRLAGAKRTVGLPDIHPGKSPVGMAFLSEGRCYPHLIGNDIGCGMGLFETGVKLKKYRQSKWVSRLNYIRELSDIWIDNPYEEESPITDLGTIGSGNHFAEFQCVEQVLNEELFAELEIAREQIHLLIHSGSRGYGQSILRRYLNPQGLPDGSEEAAGYLAEHERALLWAKRNRKLTAEKLLNYLNVDDNVRTVIDCCHNYLEKRDDGWLHRKGAVSSKKGAVVIPGSRGSLTYICVPKNNTAISLDSLSHGAGRKWARSICKSRINNKYDRDSIRTTAWKSQVICHDTNLLFQEAPEAYKNVEEVIRSLIDYDLIEVAATMRPLITFKG